MLEKLCGKDEKKWEEAKQTAKDSLDARFTLWSGVEEEITENKSAKNLQVK